uniref:PiggyBac transposable element-derived protein 4-like n=1 Tax=Kryptolebias marmoratus TaxID=37003 RepID=A0A3Q3BI75_KRYMA
MSKCIKKMKYTAQVVLERVTKRESDVSDQETTEKASVACPVDSMEEDGDVVRVKVKLESDTEWEPATQTKKKDETTSGSEDEENPNPFWPRARARANARASAGASARARARARARASARGRGSVRRSRGRRVGGSDRDQTSAPGAERWCSVDEPDITPPQPTFCPSRPPGPQLIKTASYSAVELFQLFFTNASLLTIVQNTNEYGRAHCTSPSSAWTDITLQDMFSFLSVVLYMGVVKCPNLTDYWRGGNLYNLPFPQSVIPGKKWLRILQALHLSSKEDEVANEERRGTPAFDRLGRIKPLYEEMREACRRNFHPSQEIAIDERMVASKARVFQYMKSKPVRWGFKLFVLADSSNGYTWDFFVYEGKSENTSGRGLGYDSVMKLVNPSALGTGYKLFVDNFYTIPVLFDDLLKQRIWACGAIRTSRAGFPKTALNALEPACPRGTVRWLRKGSLLFVQWRDTKDVSLCSTMHTAHGSEKINRKIKIEGGGWSVQGVPLPPAIKDYNRYVPRSLFDFVYCPMKFDLFLIFLSAIRFSGAWEELMCPTRGLDITKCSTRHAGGTRRSFTTSLTSRS